MTGSMISQAAVTSPPTTIICGLRLLMMFDIPSPKYLPAALMLASAALLPSLARPITSLTLTREELLSPGADPERRLRSEKRLSVALSEAYNSQHPLLPQLHRGPF